MSSIFTDQQLLAFLDEGLSSELMASIEAAMRRDPALCQRLVSLIGQRDAGIHSIGEIWRRKRLSCPTREQLGGFLLGLLDEPWLDYIRFHVEQVGCRICSANLADLSTQQSQQQAVSQTETTQAQNRRRKYFQSSAGYLKRG